MRQHVRISDEIAQLFWNPLRKFAIPAPVVSGLIFSILISLLKGSGLIALSFDSATIKDLCQNLFFLCVGFGFSTRMLKRAVAVSA